MVSLSGNIQYVAGVGPERAKKFAELINVTTVEDMLYYFPYKYIDRTKIYKISELNEDLPYVQIKGKIIDFRLIEGGRGKRLTAIFADETDEIELVWFQGIKWIPKTYRVYTEYIVFGKPVRFGNKLNIAHPEIEPAKEYESGLTSSLQPRYSIPEKLKEQFVSSKTMLKIQETIFRNAGDSIIETLPAYLCDKLKLPALKDALFQLHFPESALKLKTAQFRLKFEELFFIQLYLLKQKHNRKEKSAGYVFHRKNDNFTKLLFIALTFTLTNAQIKVLGEIRSDLVSGKQMNRLLQGDVGSGKTLVALFSLLMAADNRFQSCIMAPTEILAAQHYNTLTKFTKDMGINISLLTGSTKKSSRKKILPQLASGEINILIGTHALIEDIVQFHNLGLVVIDEQHRFGVAQRAKLRQKNNNIEPHILVMTATPIPRTLAMTLYGDLDISVIDELPPGRKAIKTVHYYENSTLKLFGFLKKEIALGRQVYVVFPLIKESEKMDYRDLMDGYESFSREFPPPDYLISVVHGKMKPAEKDYSMKLFVEGKAQILISTTVIEVGVDVPNASVMVIQSAERFGLSQLHQLRGRVGRGAEQSFCILMTGNKLTDEARKRMEIMVNSGNGFEIAEMDLQLRGPGDIEGTQQSGLPFTLRIANLGSDGDILNTARHEAGMILSEDPELKQHKNQLLNNGLKKLNLNGTEWSRIS